MMINKIHKKMPHRQYEKMDSEEIYDIARSEDQKTTHTF